MFKLVHDNRVQIPCENTKVFGHGGNRAHVHNEVYDWLREFASDTKGRATWVQRSYKGNVLRGSGISQSSTTPVPRSYTQLYSSSVQNEIAGAYFYFEDRGLAVLFKLAWGGK